MNKNNDKNSKKNNANNINNKNHNKQEKENIQLNNKDEKNIDNNNSLTKINDLLLENTKLKHMISERDTRIKNLEEQINQFNKNYLDEIKKKSIEAQNQVEIKVKELQTKFDADVSHIKKFAFKDKAVDLINIINNFELALSHSPSDPVVANYVQGFNMFLTMFSNYLESNNITAITPKIGDDYDPKYMEAFDSEENKNYKQNQVVKVVKKGYKLHDIVIVPATVIVAK